MKTVSMQNLLIIKLSNLFMNLKITQGVDETVQYLMTLATKTNGLTWISMIHLVKVENKLLKIVP